MALVAGVSLGVGYTVLSQLQKSGMDKAVGIENSEWASSTPAEDIKMKVMGLNIFPIVRTFMKLQSDAKRKEMYAKQGPDLSNPMLDLYDCKKETPYTIEEILTDKVWRVGYKMQHTIPRQEAKKMAKFMGMDMASNEYREKVLAGASSYGEEAVAAAKKDLDTAAVWWKKKTWKKEEIFDVPPFLLNMIVVKLNGGGLLLYAPVRVHKEEAHLLCSWLESLGPVQYIVCASSYHTLLIHDAIKAFPDAKVVGPEAAEAKLLGSKACGKFDYLTTKPDDLTKLKSALAKEGVEIESITGDVGTNAVVVYAHEEILMECDLLYGHDDGYGFNSVDESTLKKWSPDPSDGLMRLFKFAMISKPNSPFGFLPNYRFWMMDPNSLGLMGYEKPAADGSSKTEMAASLRKVLALPFKKATGVHFDKMDGDKFRRSIDACWNWLDGKPLC